MKAHLTVASIVLALGTSAQTAACDRPTPPPKREACAAEVIVAWNRRVLSIANAEDRFLTLKGVRTAAMMHIAMHDAINSIHRHYAAYAFERDAGNSDPVAAAAQAAYEVAIGQYPDQQASLKEELAAWLTPAGIRPREQRGIALGKMAAAGILAKRDGDGWEKDAQYHWQPMGPGVYAEFHEHSATPEGFVFGAGWAQVKPFVLLRPDQFRVAPPPSIDSAEYLAAYNEVKEVGRFQSPARTQDQTHLALWWKDFVENSHNRLTRQIVAARGTDLWTTARLFALLNIAIMDAYISVFDSKFAYNHWRPYTAIRWAAHDGNPATQPDEQWDNTHRHTYPFPSYPSAHGTACAAAMTVLAETYGDAYPMTMETREVNSAGPMSPMIAMEPPIRSFRGFSEAAMECALSRVYLGIHFRYDSLMGNELGNHVGRYIVGHALLPASRKR